MSLVIQAILYIIFIGGGAYLLLATWCFIENFYTQKRCADLFLTFKDFEKYFYLNPEKYIINLDNCITRKHCKRTRYYDYETCTYYIGFKNPFHYILATKLIKGYQNDKEAFEICQKQKQYLKDYLEIVQQDIDELRKEAKKR